MILKTGGAAVNIFGFNIYIPHAEYKFQGICTKKTKQLDPRSNILFYLQIFKRVCI